MGPKDPVPRTPTKTDDYRHLYPIFGYNLTDQKTILQSNTAVTLQVEVTRTLLDPKEITIYVVGLVSTKYTVDYNTLDIKMWKGDRV